MITLWSGNSLVFLKQILQGIKMNFEKWNYVRIFAIKY